MAVNNLGYRGWSGTRTSDLTRWWVITSTGVIRAWQNRWLRRFLITIWLPALFFLLSFFAWERALEQPELMNRRGPAQALIRTMIGDAAMFINFDNPESSRPEVWAWLLNSFLRYPQLFLLVLVVAMIAPPLISQDLRSRAFLLYFSRPLNRFEYILGKQATVWCYLALLSIVPGLAMYLAAVMLSPDISVVYETWDLPLYVIASSLTMIIPTASVALCLSSMTQETRYATFSWFAIWVLGWTIYALMSGAEAFSAPDEFLSEQSAWALVSPYHVLTRVQNWIFGFSTFDSSRSAMYTLVIVTVAANVVLFRRVAAPMRA